MQATQARAMALSPNLVVTLLSIVQAIALEVLVTTVRETGFLWQGGLPAAVGWLQAGIAFQGIVVLWVAYIGLVVRFVWVPRIRDMVIPFVLGVFQFVLASTLDPAWLVWWLILLAGLFVVGTVTNSSLFLQASTLEANRELFDAMARENPHYKRPLYLYAPLAGFVALILGSALLVAHFGPTSRVAFAALAVTNLVLVLQFLQIRRYWNDALFASDPLQGSRSSAG